MKNEMTRQEAIKIVGREEVERVERENCEPTNRLISDSNLTEWIATIDLENGDGCLEIYYLTTPQDEKEVEENGGDLGAIDWENRIDHYSII